MNFNNIKYVHIIGIGGSASSAIAIFLNKKSIKVSGSEMKEREGLDFLTTLGIKVLFGHKKKNILMNEKLPDVILYSPAVTALDNNNPEIIEAKRLNIKLMTWQNFIGEYLNELGLTGITVSGSEGKGTTAGILTSILKDTLYDPLAILGAKLKNLDGKKNINIYCGNGKSYILEADEYNKNFLNYHPAINIMINFQYEHPETYKNFSEYQESFYQYFQGMTGDKVLVLNATRNIIDLIKRFNLENSHKIVLFKNNINKESAEIRTDYIISDHVLTFEGNKFNLIKGNKSYDFYLPFLPGYMVYNATGAIIAGLELGLDIELIKKNILKFNGMVRRFDIIKTRNNNIFITDYGHSPESIRHIIKEIKDIFPEKKLHLVFQPHLFSRTYNFFNEFCFELKKADKVSLIDIFPAREKEEDWRNKISSIMLFEELCKYKENVYYIGKANELTKNLIDKINLEDITCFMGAGDMDQYYEKIFDHF